MLRHHIDFGEMLSNNSVGNLSRIFSMMPNGNMYCHHSGVLFASHAVPYIHKFKIYEIPNVLYIQIMRIYPPLYLPLHVFRLFSVYRNISWNDIYLFDNYVIWAGSLVPANRQPITNKSEASRPKTC